MGLSGASPVPGVALRSAVMDEIKNEPLRLLASEEERAFILYRLSQARRRLIVWLVLGIFGVANMASAWGLYRQVSYEARVDEALVIYDGASQGTTDPDACRESFTVYEGYKGAITFCNEDPDQARFAGLLDDSERRVAWWPAVFIGVGFLGFIALVLSPVGIALSLADIRKYRKYRDDQAEFLRQYNRSA